MVKVKQKVSSGALQTDIGAKTFCQIRGYVSTAPKNGRQTIVALQSALVGRPLSLPLAQLNMLGQPE